MLISQVRQQKPTANAFDASERVEFFSCRQPDQLSSFENYTRLSLETSNVVFELILHENYFSSV